MSDQLTNDTAENPRAVIGGNAPLPVQIAKMEIGDFTKAVAEYLQDEFGEMPKSVEALLEEARTLPKTVEDDEAMGVFAKLIKNLRDTAARIESTRVAEKEPYLRAEQAVDNFFIALRDKCKRPSGSKAKPGAADVLQGRLDDYNQRKLAAEQERRRLESERLAREAREAREAEERKRREEEEARAAAERARKPEIIEQKKEVADEKSVEASVASAAATVAEQRAEEAHIDTLAKPADLVRTRVDEGPTVTMGTEPYAIVEDANLLDKEKLWPFISLAEKEKALRAWAKNTGHTQQMDGAKVGKRPKTLVR